MKNTLKFRSLQEVQQEISLYNIYDNNSEPCHEILNDPKKVLEFSKTVQQLINRLIWDRRLNRYNFFWASQSYLAKQLGVTREQINRIFKRLTELGLITKIYRHMDTCLVRISSWFFKTEVRAILAPFFSNLSYFSLLFLTTPNLAFNHQIDRNVTQALFINYKSNIGIDYGTNTRARARTEISNGNSMSNNEESFNRLITPELKQLTDSIGLTKTGQAKLLAFPSEAHKHALKNIGMITSAMKPFDYLCAILNKWCQKNNRKPEYAHVFLIMQTYRLNETDNRIDKSLIKLNKNSKLISDIHTLQTCTPSQQGPVTPKKWSDEHTLKQELESKEKMLGGINKSIEHYGEWYANAKKILKSSLEKRIIELKEELRKP